jgi:hypothetical protein
MARQSGWTTWVCCALLLLAAVSARSAEDDGEDVADDEEAACVEQPLGWIARHGLVSHLAEAFPWITQPVVEDSLVTCEDEEEEDEDETVQVSFEPHLSGPRWERSWTLECEREGLLDWSCEFPEEQTFVYLSEGDVAVPISREVAPRDALQALAAMVLQSEAPGGIPDPFDASDPFLDLTVDSVLEVTREEICAGLLVIVQLDAGSEKNQLCVERAACAEPSGACPWTVRAEGGTE